MEAVRIRQQKISFRHDLLGPLLEELEEGLDNKGQAFDLVDVQTEAFGFIVAGAHTTSSSITLLLWHLLHNPDILSRLRDEIESAPGLDNSQSRYSFNRLASLKYLGATISEGFRINPVFVLPLMREVPPGGQMIAGSFIPAGVDVSVCNQVLHHDEAIFGPVLDRFTPERWLQADYDGAAHLIPFGSGHRACIGRNIAMAEILKVVAMIVSRYEIKSVDLTTGRGEKGDSSMPPTTSVGAAELVGQLLVSLSHRQGMKGVISK
jgi:cytochrome P450